MNVRSLGYRTDLLFPRFDGEIIDRDDYLVVRTPTNPTFHWGNFLLFDRPPTEGDFERWQELAKAEIGARHVALGWDSPEGEPGVIEPFLNAGFHLEDSVVLSAQSVRRPPKYCDEAELRVIKEDWEWLAVVENQVIGREPVYSENGYREYSTKQMLRRRAMADAGLGRWYGAFLDGQLVADLGVYVFDGLGRFQSVGTHPDFRRRGLCGALVHWSATHALKEMGAKTLVMVADAHYHAARIYESVGFVPVERQIGVTWWERDLPSSN